MSILLCPPLALGFSIAGVLRDSRKTYAVIILLVSGAVTAYLLWALGIIRFSTPAFGTA